MLHNQQREPAAGKTTAVPEAYLAFLSMPFVLRPFPFIPFYIEVCATLARVHDRNLSLDPQKFHPLADRLLPLLHTHTHRYTETHTHTHAPSLPPSILLFLLFLFLITMTPKPKRPHSPDEDSLDKPSLPPPSSGVTRGSSKAKKRSKMDSASASGQSKNLLQLQTDTQSFSTGASSPHEKNKVPLKDAYKMNPVRYVFSRHLFFSFLFPSPHVFIGP
ncbi:hypothetical protein B9Z19DRAFT_1080788 [Tuber borchii]|uniref:Uncharacterized protein n=1 Tax=Tuber borchii TaxID=42251 RepID=A0A2T6ZWG0_TUBBO|nr:hypothetical protein B9Z19DRAFT_1080788 [Tuber borchii]